MRTNQELLNRWKSVLQRNLSDVPAERAAEVRPGKKYRDDRGRMVTLINRNPVRVTYSREGYHETCEMSCREFDRKFSEVRDEH
ncbi:DUF4222 domain-containing protein [Yokenella regensburgei]|jgi:hypothetical protein|uniref:DUF4222 domain-containing protein n=1 Tax=Yokenella regensburgei TaxID=158877 RepID=UPI0014328329|nr:DUF4222 domain-containing protein [Yokenella regensburgei]QIU89344.1 DUF4222 domain-containing protein [Yokenella regensburgei]